MTAEELKKRQDELIHMIDVLADKKIGKLQVDNIHILRKGFFTSNI